MKYIGKLYGKIAGKHFDTGKTSEDWDKMEQEIKDLKAENKMLEKQCTRAQDIAEDLQSKLSYLVRQPRE